MSKTFVLKNEAGEYWSKQEFWCDGSEPKTVFHSIKRDEALNTLLEINAKDIALRAYVTEVDTNPKGLPIVKVTVHTDTE